MSRSERREPVVSFILTTHDRPQLLPVALRCYAEQTVTELELIVIDDGERAPADEAAITTIGGRLIRVEPGTPLGVKLNEGVAVARGTFCQKMDDDDWYAPQFAERMLSAVAQGAEGISVPSVAFCTGYWMFDVARWSVHAVPNHQIGGGSIFFSRSGWAERPFEPISSGEDWRFIRDLSEIGVALVEVKERDLFVGVRHGGDHLWLAVESGRLIEDDLQDRPRLEAGPEALFPAWALTVYRSIHEQLAARPGGRQRRPGAR
jgi:glycosyltransferase involved in cell wall biosynthesis